SSPLAAPAGGVGHASATMADLAGSGGGGVGGGDHPGAGASMSVVGLVSRAGFDGGNTLTVSSGGHGRLGRRGGTDGGRGGGAPLRRGPTARRYRPHHGAVGGAGAVDRTGGACSSTSGAGRASRACAVLTAPTSDTRKPP